MVGYLFLINKLKSSSINNLLFFRTTATMRLTLFFLVIAAFMMEESYAYAASMSCVWINGKQECTNNVNNGNGNAATSINTGGGYGIACVWINGKQECTNNVNNGNAGTSVSCVWINGKQECTKNVNNGNGIAASAINAGGPNSGVWAGPIPNNNIPFNPFQLLSKFYSDVLILPF